MSIDRFISSLLNKYFLLIYFLSISIFGNLIIIFLICSSNKKELILAVVLLFNANLIEWNMDNNEIKKQIHDYVFNNTFINKEKIKDETLIFKEGFLDSMGLVSLITFLEDTFKIQTSDQDLIEQNFESINAIHNFVIRKQSA